MGTITRKLDYALYELGEEFQSLYTRDDFNRQLIQLRSAGRTSARPTALSRLYDMLQQARIPYETGRETAYYEKLVRDASLPEFAELDKRITQTLYEKYRSYPKPEDYMRRIVEHLENPADDWGGDSLRLRILKRFIAYGDYLSAAGKNGKKVIQTYVKEKKGIKRQPTVQEVLDGLDDGVFEGLLTATKQQRKPDGKFGLLKTADDLAAGKFRESGATKKDLYLFAMVYNMTYYTGRPDETIAYDSDLEKNLFCDYYTNNLMRFVTDAYQNHLSEFERDPSGQGINYKNFAEMVYLYYIRQKLAPEEKIRRSARMIQDISAAAFKTEKMEKNRQENRYGTRQYKKQVVREKDEPVGEEILEKPEKEFMQYLLDNYDCDTYAGSYTTAKGVQDRKISEMELAAGQETAFRNYKELLQKIEDLGESLENCNYGLWFVDPAAFGKYGQQKDASYEEYVQLLLAINSFLGNTVEEDVSDADPAYERTERSRARTKALFVDSSEKITRTSLLVAYYYYYNAWHLENAQERGKSFREVFQEFRNGLNHLLLPSGYQPVSGRNIIDVVVIFSAYAYINGY